MNEDRLNPDSSPDSLDKNPANGVVWLNKLPVIIFIVMVALVFGVIIMAAFQKAAPAEEESIESEQTEVVAGEDTGNHRSWMNKYTGGTMPASSSEDMTVPTLTAPSDENLNSSSSQFIRPDTAPIQSSRPSAPPVLKTLTEEEKRIQERVKRFREDSFYDAVVADTSVRFKSEGESQSKKEEPLSNGMANMANAARTERLQQLLKVAAGGGGMSATGQTVDPNKQQQKHLFKDTERKYGYSTENRIAQLTPHELRVGTMIPAVMVGGINSDLPGEIIAQVSQNIRDTRSGLNILIPQGSRLIGSYDSNVAMGQQRVMVGWHRLQFPDGSTMELGNMGGVDHAGYAGFKDKVNNHYLRIFGNAALLSVISAAAQLSQPDGENSVNDAREELSGELGRQWGQVGQEMTRRNMRIQPTLEIRPGYKFNVMVNKDLILKPYEDMVTGS